MRNQVQMHWLPESSCQRCCCSWPGGANLVLATPINANVAVSTVASGTNEMDIDEADGEVANEEAALALVDDDPAMEIIMGGAAVTEQLRNRLQDAGPDTEMLTNLAADIAR